MSSEAGRNISFFFDSTVEIVPASVSGMNEFQFASVVLVRGSVLAFFSVRTIPNPANRTKETTGNITNFFMLLSYNSSIEYDGGVCP